MGKEKRKQSNPNVVHLRNLRVSPRKARVVIDMIRERGAQEALVLLNHSERKVAHPIAKLLESALSNISQHLPDWDLDELFVAKAYVNEGPTLRRIRPRAQGRASRINKRTSQITIELQTAEG